MRRFISAALLATALATTAGCGSSRSSLVSANRCKYTEAGTKLCGEALNQWCVDRPASILDVGCLSAENEHSSCSVNRASTECERLHREAEGK
jgi:uncharacterized protein YceK